MNVRYISFFPSFNDNLNKLFINILLFGEQTNKN